MKKTALLFALLLCTASGAQAHTAECKDTSAYAKARAVVEDLNRIVAPDGVQESYATRIGGVEQWISVRGQDKANPIVLVAHGGPASPLIPTMWQYQRPLEEYFTVVNYDQRGSGKTFASSDPDAYADTLRIARYADDAIEIAEYVRKRYGKRKVVLMGHSWGTVVAMTAALKRPDLFYAYVGIGQAINVRENERISFEFGMQQAKAHGNTAAVEEMETIAPYPGKLPLTRERIITARKWAQYYGGLTAYRTESPYFYRAPLLSPEYNDCDRAGIDRGNEFSLGRVLDEFLDVDFSRVREFPIPVVMFMGRHDYTTPSQPTADWLARVKAPYKQGVWFEHASHMIMWEEPGKWLVSLLHYVRPLTDEANGDAAR